MRSSVFLAIFASAVVLNGCGMTTSSSETHVAFGTPLDMGAVELKYSVLVLGTELGCSGTAIGPRHVITSNDCIGLFDRGPEPRLEVISFAGERPESIPALRAIRHPHEKVVWSGPFSSSELASSDVALVILERPMSTDGVTIARPNLQLTQPLKLTGFGSDENGKTTGRPRTAVSKPDWTGAQLESGYGIVGFLKGDGLACAGDSGAPAVSGGMLVGIASLMQSTDRTCRSVESNILTDVRRMRGWLRCSAEQMGFPLNQVSDANEDPWCAKNEIIEFLR